MVLQGSSTYTVCKVCVGITRAGLSHDSEIWGGGGGEEVGRASYYGT